ncbi:hypothetical protein GGF46_005503 [Coemansia sp. RSA 552]|nr:hypothetical protein GGF46_005503 [Coemansia sp. RSA 552]
MGIDIWKDGQAQRRVLWGTCGIATVGAAVGLNVAILKNLQPITRHTLTMAGNWGLCALLFFAIREPLLAEQQKKGEQLGRRRLENVEGDRLFSSTVAGALTGAMVGFAARRTKAGAVSGMALLGCMSAGGQVAATYLNKYRQRLIIRQSGLSPEPESVSWATRVRSALAIDPITLLPDWFPLRRISSTEYREMLLARREELTFELVQLRESTAAMDRRVEALIRMRESFLADS